MITLDDLPLRADLIGEFVCRLLRHLADICGPTICSQVVVDSVMDLGSEVE